MSSWSSTRSKFGEVPGLHHGIHDLNLWNWLSMGYTPAGVEVWNAIRALDYLETRREVDAKKIGMTGISGGGSTTWYTAAVDDRVAAASPVCSTITFGTQAARWVAAGQCDCIYFLNTFERDFSVVAALIAPRPLLIVSGKKDGDFPPEGYKEVARVGGRIFDLLGSPERLKELDDDVGHTYTPGFRKAIAEWMNRWLKGEEGSVELPKGEETGKEAPEVLACLPAIPDDSINDSIHNRFVGRTAAVGREKVLAELKEKTFRGFPKGDLPFETQVGRGTGGWAARYARYKDVTFVSEPGLRVRAQLYRAPGEKKGTRLLVVAKRAGDSIYFLDLDELLPLLGRVDILVLNPRLTEHPVSAFEYAEIERSSAWVGRTIGSMQVWDILRSVEWAIREEKLSPESISLFGKGATGILCLYAALLDERVHEVILQDPPSSHRQGPALLNVLRITDIPEAAGLLAPRRLTILGGVPDAFRGAREAASLREAFRAWER